MPMFIDTSPAGECIFCRLIAGEIPAAVVYEDDQTIAFMDIGQVNPGMCWLPANAMPLICLN